MSQRHYLPFTIYPDLSTLRFDVFSSEEKEALSVAEIVSSSLVDPQSECAIVGGLYDPAMGPSTVASEPCKTCKNSYHECNGHMGHIKLCLYVYNQMFLRTMYKILRMSCLRDDCFKLQISDHASEIVILQIKLAEMGYVHQPQELEIFKIHSKLFPDIENMQNQIAEYKDLLKEPLTNVCLTKTTEELLSSIRNATINNNRGKKCIHCEKPLVNFKYIDGQLYMIMKSGYNAFAAIENDRFLLPHKCRQFLKDIYKHNTKLLPYLFPVLNRDLACPTDIFFTDTVLVTPPNSRTHNQQTKTYINIIKNNENLRAVISVILSLRENSPLENRLNEWKNLQFEIKEDDNNIDFAAVTSVKEGRHNSKSDEEIVADLRGTTLAAKVSIAWLDLQSSVHQTYNAKDDNKRDIQGLKQLIDEKKGIIRQNMLGKRVNYAGRTVITPDPNINIDEIGLPEVFAKKLTYPVAVTKWNVEEIRKYVLNGPDVYPGANFINNGNLINLGNKAIRECNAKTLIVGNQKTIVYRHLVNGDILLLNRQPSWHRPNLMAHKVKVLKGEKTLHLHYSNCMSYNANFDGDEMNFHCPQSEEARSEAYNLVNVANHYLVPKNGTPLGGLIQDNIIAGFKMTLRGRFFNREDYQQLVFVGLSHLNKDITLLPPAILKPHKLWSGKQVVSTIILNVIPRECAPINLMSTEKSNKKSQYNWQNEQPSKWRTGGTALAQYDMTETEIIIRGGEVLVGVMDKKHFGATPYGLIHSIYELYGGACSTQLLSSFSKLFTCFLQREGFTLGVQDILLVAEADKKRRKQIEKCRKIGYKIVRSALNLPKDVSPSELASKMEGEYGKNPVFQNQLDAGFKTKLSYYTNKINRACMSGLLNQFPENNLQLMIRCGAKGSIVNAMQIFSLLGQIELEDKRLPLMISGKSLPSFNAYDTTPKSGGFVDGRFLTGIAPQDFFFHCMTGREGLINKAVKTCKSGYLRRCLVNHLQGLHANYDMTVRDSDNCVVQFMYGEDGMDIAKAQFLCSDYLPFLDANAAAIVKDDVVAKLSNGEFNEEIKKYKKSIRQWQKKNNQQIKVSNCTKQHESECPITKEHKSKCPRAKEPKSKCPDPTFNKYRSDNFLGAIPESLDKLCRSYLAKSKSSKREFSTLMNVKCMTSLVTPGEPVGLLAATSIGESSTKMTLNSFHFAGKDEMNLTLGISRLQEILIRASRDIKTPFMKIPFKESITDRKAKRFCLKLNPVTLADVLKSIDVQLSVALVPKRMKVCVLQFNFLPRELYKDEYCVKRKQIRTYVEEEFFKLMFEAIGVNHKLEKNKKQENDNNGPDNDADAVVNNTHVSGDDDDKNYTEYKSSHSSDSDNEAMDYECDSEDNKYDYEDNEYEGSVYEDDKYDYEDNEYEDEVVVDNDEVDGNEEQGSLMDELDESIIEVLDDYDQIVENVRKIYDGVTGYDFDWENHLWCKLSFNLPIVDNVDLPALLQEVASTAFVSQVPLIRHAIVDYNEKLILKTEGTNITEMFKYDKVLDLNRLYTNHIYKVAQTYGIEAAARVIVKETQTVFTTSGMSVDIRHLLLIADYMTFNGTIQPLNRDGMQFSSSPLQQLAFENPLKTFELATVFDRCDSLETPASQIMVGKTCKGGTGSFDLFPNLRKKN